MPNTTLSIPSPSPGDLSHLPQPVQDRINDLVAARDAAKRSATPLYNELVAMRQEVQELKGLHQVAVQSGNENEIARTLRALERGKAAEAQLKSQYDALASIRRRMDKIIPPVLKYAAPPPRGKSKPFALWNGKPAKGTAESIRIDLKALRDQRLTIAEAPRTLDEALAYVNSYVDEIAGSKSRRPRAGLEKRYDRVSNDRETASTWPVVHWPEIHLNAVADMHAGDEGVTVLDSLGTLIWLIGSEPVKAKLRAEMTEAYQGVFALSRNEKKAQLAKIDQQIFDLEQQMCALAWASYEAGGPLDIPSDVNPAAVLGLARG